MTEFLRGAGVASLLLLPLLGGCASNGCEFLTYETLPEEAPPLVLPEGVPAPAERGAFRVPELAATASGACIAEPPMTLPPEVLEAPENDEGAEAEDS